MINKHGNRYNIISVESYFAEVIRGRIKGHSGIGKFGAGISATGGGFSGVWDVDGTMYPFPASGSADLVHFSGTVAEDHMSGVAARKIRIFGVDENWNYVDEIVEMSGVALQYSVNKYARVYRAFTTEVGSLDTNSGTISIQLSGTSTTLARIKSGNGQTLMAWFPIAKGYEGELISASVSVIADNNSAAKASKFNLMVRSHSIVAGSEVFHGAIVKGILGVKDSVYDRGFTFPLPLEERSEVYILSNAVGASTFVTATFDIVLRTKTTDDT